MKKKIIAICLCVALVAVGIVGATLAYFTDTDSKTNTFAVGKVDITLNDEFVQNSKLVPAVVDENSNILNGVDKVVSVTNNTGSEDAYVRVHIAVPASIDDLIGLWYDDAAGWNWNDKDTRVDYTVTINNVKYNVVCLTYSEKMAAEDTTTNVFEWVVMNPEVTNEDVANISNNFNIIVFAEGCQAAGFTDAFTALEEAFGTPSATENPWNNYTAPEAGE